MVYTVNLEVVSKDQNQDMRILTCKRYGRKMKTADTKAKDFNE